MQKKFIIITGRSGCGKGTQSEMLESYLKKIYEENKNDSGLEVKHVTTGGNFREFIKNENYSSIKTRDTINSGGLMPEFLAIWNWSNIFINHLKENMTVILDGAPRRIIEVDALRTAIPFYGYAGATIIYLDVSEEWTRKRLTERGREDDQNEEEVSRKMKWFAEDMLPCIKYYEEESKKENTKDNNSYKFLHINGEQSVEDVNAEILQKLGL